jgi:hypothetical protein
MSYRVSRLLREIKAAPNHRRLKVSITAGNAKVEYRRCSMHENGDPKCGWPLVYSL